jgi:hypothetical protein
MKRDRLLPAWLAIALSSIAAFAVWFSIAINAPAAIAESEQANFWKRNFNGWIGIGFSCRINPDESWTRQVCDAARQHARFLAATAKITYVDHGDGSPDAIMESARGGNNLTNALHLNVKVLATDSQFRGVYVRTWASDYYLGAVDTGWRETNMTADRDGPSGKPKAGDLVLWDREFIASGDKSSDLQQAIITNMQTFLTEFSALFAEHKTD